MGTQSLVESGKFLKVAEQADATRHCLRSILVQSPKSEDLMQLDVGIRILDSVLGCMKTRSWRSWSESAPFLSVIDRKTYRSLTAPDAHMDIFWSIPREIENTKRLFCRIRWDIQTKGAFNRPRQPEIEKIISAFGNLNRVALDRFNELRE